MRNEEQKLNTFPEIQILANLIQKANKTIDSFLIKAKHILIKQGPNIRIKQPKPITHISPPRINPKLPHPFHLLNLWLKPFQKQMNLIIAFP